jgi:hypothetical protein
VGKNRPDDAEIDKMMLFGEVQYVDFDKHLIPENNLFAPTFHKRMSFRHEQEFRAAFSIFGEGMAEQSDTLVSDPWKTNAPTGEYIDVNVGKLINTLYISPTAPGWFAELVEMILERYDVECNVQRSSLDDDPVF